MLRRHRILRGLVVDVGCGSGPLAARLVETGYDVVGFDVSAAMVRLARRNAPGARFRVGSLTAIRIPRCDAIVALNEVLNYVVEPHGRLNAIRGFFRRAYDALRPGGVLIFDFIESAEHRTYAAKSRAGPDWAIVARAEASRSGRLLTRYITTFRKIGAEYRKSIETHEVRVYDRARIRTALTAAGFTVKMRRSYGRVRLLPSDVAVIAWRPVPTPAKRCDASDR